MLRFMVIATMLLIMIIILLAVALVNYGETRDPSLRTRLLALGLDDCKAYVRDVTASVGDTLLYYDFVFACDFALTFRESCGKSVNSRTVLGNEMRALEERFTYGMEEIRMLRDDENISYRSLEKSVRRILGIQHEMQQFLSRLPERRVQPC